MLQVTRQQRVSLPTVVRDARSSRPACGYFCSAMRCPMNCAQGALSGTDAPMHWHISSRPGFRGG